MELLKAGWMCCEICSLFFLLRLLRSNQNLTCDSGGLESWSCSKNYVAQKVSAPGVLRLFLVMPSSCDLCCQEDNFAGPEHEKSLCFEDQQPHEVFQTDKGDEELGDVSESSVRFTCSWPSIHHSSIRAQMQQKTSSVEPEDQKGLASMRFALRHSLGSQSMCTKKHVHLT